MSAPGYALGAAWLCDGHGFWISPLPDCELMMASEARKLGAPVPDDEADPEPIGDPCLDDSGSDLPW